jgi:hypothetical protein
VRIRNKISASRRPRKSLTFKPATHCVQRQRQNGLTRHNTSNRRDHEDSSRSVQPLQPSARAAGLQMPSARSSPLRAAPTTPASAHRASAGTAAPTLITRRPQPPTSSSTSSCSAQWSLPQCVRSTCRRQQLQQAARAAARQEWCSASAKKRGRGLDMSAPCAAHQPSRHRCCVPAAAACLQQLQQQQAAAAAAAYAASLGLTCSYYFALATAGRLLVQQAGPQQSLACPAATGSTLSEH